MAPCLTASILDALRCRVVVWGGYMRLDSYACGMVTTALLVVLAFVQ